MEEQKNIIEYPNVTVNHFGLGDKSIVIHSHINNKGKMVLNKEEAILLMLELYKFVNN